MCDNFFLIFSRSQHDENILNTFLNQWVDITIYSLCDCNCQEWNKGQKNNCHCVFPDIEQQAWSRYLQQILLSPLRLQGDYKDKKCFSDLDRLTSVWKSVALSLSPLQPNAKPKFTNRRCWILVNNWKANLEESFARAGEHKLNSQVNGNLVEYLITIPAIGLFLSIRLCIHVRCGSRTKWGRADHFIFSWSICSL